MLYYGHRKTSFSVLEEGALNSASEYLSFLYFMYLKRA